MTDDDANCLQSIKWTANPPQDIADGIPYATHSGVLEVFGKSMRCHKLSSGETVFDADDFKAFFEGMFDPANPID